jgi:hypothetical protein
VHLAGGGVERIPRPPGETHLDDRVRADEPDTVVALGATVEVVGPRTGMWCSGSDPPPVRLRTVNGAAYRPGVTVRVVVSPWRLRSLTTPSWRAELKVMGTRRETLMRRILGRAGVAVATATTLFTLAAGAADAEGGCTMDGVTYPDGSSLVTANGGGWYTSQRCDNGSWRWEWVKQLPPDLR